MNKWKKIGIAAALGTMTFSAAHIINKLIFSSAVSKNITENNEEKIYEWKFGNISYTVRGKGSPLLLIHDLQSISSSYDWNKIVNILSRDHEVYTLDLLGCGHSDKPNITYTAYMYTQMLQDFIVNVMHKKTDIVVHGNSAPMTIMAAYINPYLFGNIILVNPQDIKKAMKSPDKKSEIRRFLLNSPIIGTLIYNICMRREKIRADFITKYLYNRNNANDTLINAYHENAHLMGSSAKYLFTSTQCNYLTASAAKAVSELNNNIYIITGKQDRDACIAAEEYKTLNPSIEVVSIDKAKYYPQIEQPLGFVKNIRLFTSVPCTIK